MCVKLPVMRIIKNKSLPDRLRQTMGQYSSCHFATLLTYTILRYIQNADAVLTLQKKIKATALN